MDKCAMCGKNSVKDACFRRPYDLKGETFDLMATFSKCTNCEFEFATESQLSDIRIMTADAYKKKHGLLTSVEIKKFRESLGMSQVEFAAFLNVGEASIPRWETSFVQDESMNRLMVLAMSSPESVAHKRSGNTNFSLSRQVELAIIAIRKCDSPLFAWKMLFYFDFYAFKSIGRSLTGSDYLAADYGPIPVNYKELSKHMIDVGVVERSSKESWKVKRSEDVSVFDKQEIEAISVVVDLIKSHGKQKVFEMSHNEDAYRSTKPWDIIDYSHAKTLKHPKSKKA